MPNNASARRGKDKKNKDKKKKDNKKTDTPPLPKEDTASVNSGTLSLSAAGKEQASDSNPLSLSIEEKQEQDFSLAVDRLEKATQENPEAILDEKSKLNWTRTVVLVEFHKTTTTGSDVRTALHRKFRAEHQEANPLASNAETKMHADMSVLRAAIDWHRRGPQRKNDLLLSSALSERIKEDEFLVRGPAQDALLLEHSLTLTKEEEGNLLAEVMEANPNTAARELGKALRTRRVQAALTWHRNRVQEGKDSPLSLSGTAKQTELPSLEAQPKSDSSTTVRYYLSLTEEERTPVFNATKLANPKADASAFNKAYKIALWKADSLKKGIDPGQNWEAVDYSPIPDTYSEDSGQESSTSSEDGLQAIRNDLERQRQRALSPKENKYLAGLKRSPDKPQPNAQGKQALDKDSFSLISPLKQVGITTAIEEQVKRAGDSSGHGGSTSWNPFPCSSSCCSTRWLTDSS
jgi:hypothetical protein